jgi:uncharacterized protein (DUF2236 family)
VGVQQEDLPENWRGFRAYFEHMVDQELGPNETVDRVLAVARKPGGPEVPLLPELLWRAIRLPAARLMYLGGVGLLPAGLRERLHIPWSRRDERHFRRLAASSRALERVLPATLKAFGPTQLRWRRRAIARGPFGESAALPRDR